MVDTTVVSAQDVRAKEIAADLNAVAEKKEALIQEINAKLQADPFATDWKVKFADKPVTERSVEFRAALRAAIAFDDTAEYSGEINHNREIVIGRRDVPQPKVERFFND